MTLPPFQTVAILLMAILGTQITRFFPFILFRKRGSTHPYITYLGQVLPYAAIGLLVIYCLRNISFQSSGRGLPEGLAILTILLLHYWKENTLLSIGAGTFVYMFLVQSVC